MLVELDKEGGAAQWTAKRLDSRPASAEEPERLAHMMGPCTGSRRVHVERWLDPIGLRHKTSLDFSAETNRFVQSMRVITICAGQQNHFVALAGPRHIQRELQYSASEPHATMLPCRNDVLDNAKWAAAVRKSWYDTERAG